MPRPKQSDVASVDSHMPWLAKIHCACNFLDIIEIKVKSKKAMIT